MPTAPDIAPKYEKGDWVTFRYGSRSVWARVIEDRGNLGVNRRRLYRIRLAQDADEPVAFEVPEDDLTPAVLETQDIIHYLKAGGLVSILQSNLGGKNPPHAWLTLDSRGRVTHTFIADRGIIGGAEVPFWTLDKDRIEWHEKNAVLDFLSSFGLSETDAREVVEAIGVSMPPDA